MFVLQIRANPETDPDYGPEPPAPQEGEDTEVLDDGTIKGHWDKRLTSFQKLMFIKGWLTNYLATRIVSNSSTKLFEY